MKSVNAAPCVVVINLYLQACNELFSAYGLTALLEKQKGEKRDPSRACYVSVLGANGEDIRLLSTLNIEAPLLASMHPSGAGNVSQRDLEDWCRELNNQLVGRVKNKLLRFGCEVMTGLPSLITGTDIVTVSPPDLDFRQYFFASERGCLTSTLSTLLAPALEFKQKKSLADGEAVMREGALSLF